MSKEEKRRRAVAVQDVSRERAMLAVFFQNEMQGWVSNGKQSSTFDRAETRYCIATKDIS